MTTAVQRLAREQLPQAALKYLDHLPQEQQEALAGQLVKSMEEKDARVERALNRALDVVPSPLRGTVRKLLFS